MPDPESPFVDVTELSLSDDEAWQTPAVVRYVRHVLEDLGLPPEVIGFLTMRTDAGRE